MHPVRRKGKATASIRGAAAPAHNSSSIEREAPTKPCPPIARPSIPSFTLRDHGQRRVTTSIQAAWDLGSAARQEDTEGQGAREGETRERWLGAKSIPTTWDPSVGAGREEEEGINQEHQGVMESHHPGGVGL
jgi:hypothetical protein